MARPSLGLPMWDRERGDNFLDGAAPWYDVYETKDGGYMSVGALENPFYTIFLQVLPLQNFIPQLDTPDPSDFIIQGETFILSPPLSNSLPPSPPLKSNGSRPLALLRLIPHHFLPLQNPRRMDRHLPAHRRMLRTRFEPTRSRQRRVGVR